MMAYAGGHFRQDTQIEVNDVPAGEYIRIDFTDPAAECFQHSAFIGIANRLLGHLPVVGVNDEHFIDHGGSPSVQRRVQRDCQ